MRDTPKPQLTLFDVDIYSNVTLPNSTLTKAPQRAQSKDKRGKHESQR
jgi:hypothetical protein